MVTEVLDSVDDGQFGPRSIRIFPNPSSNQITISQWQDLDWINWTILSTQGRAIKSGSSNRLDTQISLHDVPNGIYFIQVNEMIHKLIVHKI